MQTSAEVGFAVLLDEATNMKAFYLSVTTTPHQGGQRPNALNCRFASQLLLILVGTFRDLQGLFTLAKILSD